MIKHILLAPVFLLASVSFGQTDSTATPAATPPESTTAVAPAPPAPPRTPKDMRPMKDRLGFGLGTGFWISPSQTYIEVAPTLAYRFPKVLITGIGYRYIYRHNRYNNTDLHSHGPLFFARANLTKRIYLWSEYEILSSQYYDNSYVSDEVIYSKATIDSWFVGLGFIRQVGRKGGLSMQILYNLLYDKNPNSPYYSALTYRVGYFF